MKGKIYKNRLSTGGNEQQQQFAQNPLLYNQFYQQQSSQKPLFNQYRAQDRYTRNIANNNDEESEAFYKSPNRTIISGLYEKEKPNYSYASVDNRSAMHKPSINEHFAPLTDKLTRQDSQQTNSRFLKRVVSNPDLNFSAQNARQIREQHEQNHQQQQKIDDQWYLNLNNSTHTRSTMLSPNRLRARTPLKGNNDNNSSQFMNKRAFAYELDNINSYSNGLPINTEIRTRIGPTSFHTNTPMPQPSVFVLPNNNDNSRIMTTDYVSSYQKRHKQRITALQSQHEVEIQFYQEEILSKDQLIEEMGRLLKQKEEIIRKLQSQNANLTSRSYPSFANGNNSCRE